MRNEWSEFSGKEYRLENLGRPAIFLMPIKKLKKKFAGTTIEKDLHRFLIEHFGAYTSSTVPQFGFWRNLKKIPAIDECREYEVSFLGKDRIPVLIKKLSEVASAMKEECVYLKAGQYSCLVYPNTQGK